MALTTNTGATVNTPRTLLSLCFVLLLPACPGMDKLSPDDSATPIDDSGHPDDSAEGEGEGEGETGDDCPDVPTLDLDALLVNLWSGSWRGYDDTGWFRFEAGGGFTGLAANPAAPSREDYAGTWKASQGDSSTLTLDYVDPYPYGGGDPIEVEQIIHLDLSTGLDEDRCTRPQLSFWWDDFNTVEGHDAESGLMLLLLRD